MKKIRNVFAALCCMIFSAALFAAPSVSLEPEVIHGKKADVKKYSLSNGIPVYYIENTDNQVDVVSIVVKGGRSYLTPEQSGLEMALFKVMASSSSRYSYEKRQQIAYEKSSSIYENAMNNATVLSLSCLNYYMKDMLPVLTDGFLNPSYSKQVYETIMTGLVQSLQATQNDPWSLLQYSMEKYAYENHPYEASTDPTPESISNLTVDAMKKWHKTILDSRRICIVAVTSVKPEEIVKSLESSLGKVNALNTPLKEVKFQPISVSGEPVVLTSDSATGTGYAVRIFPTPHCSDSEYVAASLASEIFSTTMFNIIRTKNGSCYSTASFVGSTSGMGGEYFYMISDLKNFSKYINEARRIMASGKYVTKLNDDGSYAYTTIDAVLPGVKNVMINSIYNGNIKTAGRAANYVSALINYGDINAYETLVDRIHEVSAQDVIRVFNKYWVDQNGRWITVVGPESENSVTFEK